jgi:hypothetical protein
LCSYPVHWQLNARLVNGLVKYLFSFFFKHTDFHICALIVGNTRVSCAWVGCQRDRKGLVRKNKRLLVPTKVNTNGAFVNLVRHFDRGGSKRCWVCRF